MADEWTNAFAGAPASSTAKVRAVDATTNPDVKKMAVCALKMGLKNSQQMRMVTAALFRCLKVPTKSPFFECVTKANAAFNEAVKGNTQHGQGCPDCYCVPALLLECMKAVDAETKQKIETWLNAHRKGSPELFRSVKCCCWEKMYSSEWKRIFILLSPEDKEIEDIIVRCMVNAGGVELYGKAPKWANEREAQALLDAMQ